MTINNKLRDEGIAHSLFVSRYATGTARRMVNLLNTADAELHARLLVSLDGLDPDDYTVKRLSSLLSSVRDINRSATSLMFDGLYAEMKEFAGYEMGYQYSLFDALLPDEVLRHFPLAGITGEQVYAAAMARPFQGRLLRDWAESLESDRWDKIVNTIKNGYLLGDTTEEIARRVRGTKSKNYQDSTLQISRENATSIVKTAVTHIAAVARDKFAENNADIIDCKQWISTLDNKTTPACIIRDGLKYSLDNKSIGHNVPYLQGPGRLHFCCRSTEILVVKSWRDLGIDADEMSEGTRASMDGQVRADTKYRDWLIRQPYRRQVQVLGITRAKLMRDGGMSPSEFFSDKGEWLSLQQLKGIDDQAFKDAGYD